MKFSQLYDVFYFIVFLVEKVLYNTFRVVCWKIAYGIRVLMFRRTTMYILNNVYYIKTYDFNTTYVCITFNDNIFVSTIHPEKYR